MYFVGHLYGQLLFQLSLSLQLDFFFGSTNLYCDLPSPTQVLIMSNMYYVGLLIYMGKFYFYCHCQFSCPKFSNTCTWTHVPMYPHPENSCIEVGRANLKTKLSPNFDRVGLSFILLSFSQIGIRFTFLLHKQLYFYCI